MQFQLVKSCHRSAKQRILALDNSLSLTDCFAYAKSFRGLALNYAPAARRVKVGAASSNHSEQLNFNDEGWYITIIIAVALFELVNIGLAVYIDRFALKEYFS